MGYLEAIVTCDPESNSDRWFIDRGFNVVKMKAGLVISGDKKEFETTFKTDLGSIEGDVDLLVPDDLKETVSSIQIPKLDYQ